MSTRLSVRHKGEFSKGQTLNKHRYLRSCRLLLDMIGKRAVVMFGVAKYTFAELLD